MNASVKGALVLGVTVAILGLVFAVAGLHTNPMAAFAFVILAVLLNIGVIIWTLRATRSTNGYGGQLLAGVVIGLVAGVIIFASSWTMTGVIFPDYYDEMYDGYLEFFENAGMDEAQIDKQMAALENVTPAGPALQGAIGTIITSVVVAAIAGIFLRRKD